MGVSGEDKIIDADVRTRDITSIEADNSLGLKLIQYGDFSPFLGLP